MDAPIGRSMTEKDCMDLASLIFLIFVYISDSDKDITPQEVQRFQALMNDLQWTDNEDVCRALTMLRFNYTATWASYEAGTLSADPAAITRHLARFDLEFGAERTDALKASLVALIQRVDRGPSGVRIAKVESRGRAEARRKVETLMAGALSAVAELAMPGPDAGPEPARPSAMDAGLRPEAAGGTAGDAAVWRGGRIRLRCVGRVAETPDTTTYILAAHPPLRFDYKPGQFVTLDLPVDGRILRRSYTISSSPSRPHTLSVTVKRVPDGRASAWLHATMAPGLELELTGPHGRFTCADRPAAKLLLIAAGSGITPMMSMLRWAADTRSAADIVMINHVRTPEDVIFALELQHLSAQLGDALRLAVVPSRRGPGQPWFGLTGRFSEAQLRALAPDFMEREIYLCGPGGYMDAARTLVRGLGFPMARLHEESFGAAAPARPAVPELPVAVPGIVVETAPASLPGGTLVFRSSSRSVSCGAGEFILDAAERHAIAVDSSCRSGICGTCRMKKLSGVVSMDGQHALSEQEIAEGYFLACVGQPRGTVVIDA